MSTVSEEEFFILNFGTRLLTAFTDRNILIPIALETLADFSRGVRVAILSLSEEGSAAMLKVEGTWANKRAHLESRLIPFEEAMFENAASSRHSRIYPLRLDEDVPLPASNQESRDGRCLCLPLVGSRFRTIGWVSIELSAQENLEFQELQQLRILATVLAISLENAALFSLAVCDSLTGLFVRRYYEIRVDEELSKLRRQPGQVSIILFDLDHFKEINDRYGHTTGDRVLQEFALLLRRCFRKGIDVVCRHGGEEFVVLLPDTGLEAAVHAAERIRLRCETQSFVEPSLGLKVTVSGGVACLDSSCTREAEALFEQADGRLYQAKQSGRNRIEPQIKACVSAKV